MKIKDIVTEAGILNKIGRGLGKVATLPFKTLDAIAGGTGEVGTVNQRLASKKAKLDKQEALQTKADLMAVNQSYDNFIQFIENQGIRFNDPRTYTQESLANLLKGFALYFYGSDYTSGPYIKNEIGKFPLPTQINPGSAEKYLKDTGKIFVDVNKDILAYQISQMSTADKNAGAASTNTAEPSTTAAAAQANPVGLPANVKVLATSPIVLQVGKEKFELDDQNIWHPLNRPNVAVSPGQAGVLNKYLLLI